MSLALIGQAVSEKKMFENNGHIHVFSPRVWADNSLRIFCFSLTQLFSQFSLLLQILIK